MENNNIEQTTIEKTNNKPEESKGGDSSRSTTALLILAIVVPTTIFASILHAAHPTGSLFSMLANIYLTVYQVGLGALLMLGINEAGNFIFPVEDKKHGGNVAYWLLIVLSLSTFIASSWNALDITMFNIGSWKFWFITMSLVYFIVTSAFAVDFKDITVGYFMTAAFTFFVMSLSWLISSGGWQLVIMAIGIAAMADTFAYYGGKKYGKRKAFPNVSPNKTIEGVITGFFVAVAFGWALYFLAFMMTNQWLMATNFSGIYPLLIIVICAAISPFGDLTFSKIKRSYGKKDFSNLLPGHGGIFDRLDSHIFVTTTLVLLTQLL